MLNRNLLLLAIVAFLIAAFAVSCADDSENDSDPLSLQDWIDLGKRLLGEGDGEAAAEAFENALCIDKKSPDAGYGVVLSGPVSFANFMDQIIGTLASITFNPEDDPTRNEPQAFSIDQVENPIHEYLLTYNVPYVWRSEDLFAQLAENGDLAFDLEWLPITINHDELLAFSGRFDRTDLSMFGALNSLILGLYDFILAHDLAFDFTAFVFPEIEDGASTIETIDTIVALLEDLLYSKTHPTFLYLEPEYGAEFMGEAGIAFGRAFERCDEAFGLLARETSPQGADQFRYLDTDRDGDYDRFDDPVQFGESLTFDATTAWIVHGFCEDLGPIFLEGSAFDEDPYTISLLTPAAFNELLIALGVLPLDLGPFTIETLPDWGGINVGKFFHDPSIDGFRSILVALIDLWHWIAPLLENAE